MAVPVLEGYLESGNFASSASWTVNAPAGIVSGELLLASLQATVAPNSVPSGWTLVDSNASTSPRQYLYWKLATGSEPASYTWGYASGSSGWAQVHRISGADQTSPIAASSKNVANPVALPALTPPVVDCLELAFVILASSAAQTWTPSDGGFINHYTLSAGHLSLTAQPSLFRQNLSTATATGVETFTPSAGASHRGILVLIRPAGPAAQQITPPAIASAEAHGAPTVIPGAVLVAPSEIPSAESFGNALVAVVGGPQFVLPAGIASEELVGAATVISTQIVTPGYIASGEAFGGATVVLGPPVLNVLGIPSEEEFGIPGILQWAVGPAVGSDTEGVGVGGSGELVLPHIWLPPSRRANPGYFRIKLTSLHYLGVPGSSLRRPARTLARIEDFTDAKVDIPINDAREGKVTIGMNDPAAAHVAPYSTMLHLVYVTPTSSHLVFWGIVTQPEWNPDDETLTIPAVDMSLRLQHRQIRWGTRILNSSVDPVEPNPFNTASSKRSTGRIAIDYIGLRWLRDVGRNTESMNSRGVPPLGITDGLSTADMLDLATEYTMEGRRGDIVWDVMQELVSYQVAPDFELEPRDTTFGVYARLNTYARQGSADPSRIHFHDGFGLDNALIVYQPGGKVVTHNHVLSSGDETRVTLADLDSSANLGAYVQWDSTDYPAKATDALTDQAQQTLDAYGTPPDYFSIKPNLDSDRYYLDDFVVGDALTAAVRRGVLQRTLTGDITSVSLAQADAAGNVQPELEVAVAQSRTTQDEGDV